MSGVQVGEGVKNPAWTVEVADQQTTVVVPLKRVQAGMDVAAKMPADHLVCVGQVLAVRSPGVRPTASNGWTPARLARSVVVPPHGVDIVTAGEQRSEEGDLLLRRRTTIDIDGNRI